MSQDTKQDMKVSMVNAPEEDPTVKEIADDFLKDEKPKETPLGEEAPAEEKSSVTSDEDLDTPNSVEDLDPDEELWEGGPAAKEIIAWKQEFGDVYVTSITLDKHVVWRTLNRFEYKNHIKQLEQLTASGQMSQGEASLFNEEAIAEMCILYPPYSRTNVAEELAGVPSIITQEVMEASGFEALEVRKL